MERHPFTEKHLRGPYQGQSNECLMAQQLSDMGWKILAHNKKIIGVQVDLLVRDPKGRQFVVEVKSKRAVEFGGISKKQKERLKKVVLWLCQREPTGLLLVVPSERRPIILEIQD